MSETTLHNYLILLGFGLFLYGVFAESWIKLIGGIVLLYLMKEEPRKTATNGNHSQEKPKSNLKGGEWGVEQSSIPDTHSKEKTLKGGLKK